MEYDALREKWYNNISVLYEIVKCVKEREVALLANDLKAVRCIKVHNMNYLWSNFKRFRFFSENYNLYQSLAVLKDMPCFSFKIDERKAQQKWFNEKFNDFVMGYDIGLDFDNDGDYLQTWNDCNVVKEVFDENKIAYRLKCSGSGFHIEIPADFMQECYPEKDVNEIIKMAELLGNRLTSFLDLKTMDLSIFDIRRIWKVAYSFDVKSGNIALPLDDEQFKEMGYVNGLKVVSCERLINEDFRVRNRGLMLRQGSVKIARKFFDDVVVGYLSG